MAVIRKYLSAYCTALSRTSFTRVYIDAFAGAGTRNVVTDRGGAESDGKLGLLGMDSPADEGVEEVAVRHGSPLQALAITPGFHEFIFIERDRHSMDELKRQVTQSELLNNRPVEFHESDANVALLRVSQADWTRRRAVAFLDPFALQVKWETIAAIAATKAIDMWLLFPAMAVNRMLPRSGKVPQQWADRLDEAFGDQTWRAEFYEQTYAADLFGESLPTKTPRPFEQLSAFLTKRLSTVFAATHGKPLVLRTSSGSPLFLLCFGCGNEKGGPIARRIAQYLIDGNQKR